MVQSVEEYFGSPDQQLLQKRAYSLWTLMKDNPEYACHGRAVGLADGKSSNIEQQIALARLQGVGPADGLPREELAKRQKALETAGLSTDVYDHWEGSSDSFDAAEVVLRDRALPDDLTAIAAGADASTDDLNALDQLTQSCEVLLPMGAFVRGAERPSVFLYAKDAGGRLVGAAAAVAQYHKTHPMKDKVWWGMLSTDSRRRGEGIALILGAMALRDVRQKLGCNRWFTGIRAGNGASEALCSKLGLHRTDTVDLIAIDPDAFGKNRMTK